MLVRDNSAMVHFQEELEIEELVGYIWDNRDILE